VKGFHFGIDFLGGTELIIEFKEPAQVGKIRSALDAAGFQKAEIKGYGLPTRVLVRTEAQGEGTSIGDRIRTSLEQNFPDQAPKVLQEQKIGPKIGQELRRNALFAVLFSLLAMGIYVAFRFEFIYGLGAVVALFHDVAVALGFVALMDGLTPYTNFEIYQNMIVTTTTTIITTS